MTILVGSTDRFTCICVLMDLTLDLLREMTPSRNWCSCVVVLMLRPALDAEKVDGPVVNIIMELTLWPDKVCVMTPGLQFNRSTVPVTCLYPLLVMPMALPRHWEMAGVEILVNSVILPTIGSAWFASPVTSTLFVTVVGYGCCYVFVLWL